MQETTEKGAGAVEASAEATADDQAKRFAKFEKTLNKATLAGKFTIVGRDAEPKEERYEIRRVKKLEQDDLWLFVARIKYGKNDLVVPMPLQVKWVASTPVITLDNVTIPGLGTFSAYVIIDNDKYAGTWTHGKVSGHLFGRIEHEAEEKKTE
ncbi:MAG: hypothetical protein COA78_38110 [Blastopirellula sp.]|nr:MAG: hypothetical protein COA78_38110 [Blastopirellula sp.]